MPSKGYGTWRRDFEVNGDMFTGIVKAVGTVSSVVAREGGARIQVDVGYLAAGLGVGDSVAVNGCCLTVTEVEGSLVSFDAVAETLRRSNLGTLRAGSRVNLELALPAGAPMGGHFVQGHVDCTGEVVGLVEEGESRRVRVSFPREFSNYVVEKGSVAVDGVSLTVAAREDNWLEVVLVPHTIGSTTAGAWEIGHEPNLEFDVLAKYVEACLRPHAEKKRTAP